LVVAHYLPPKGRDLRLDLFRGNANWAIFLDHSVAILREAVQRGINHIDTSDYLEFNDRWDPMPGEDPSPFEPKANDWGWFEGRLVALDYSLPAWQDID
jgi:hypothetical protein